MRRPIRLSSLPGDPATTRTYRHPRRTRYTGPLPGLSGDPQEWLAEKLQASPHSRHSRRISQVCFTTRAWAVESSHAFPPPDTRVFAATIPSAWNAPRDQLLLLDGPRPDRLKRAAAVSPVRHTMADRRLKCFRRNLTRDCSPRTHQL